MFIYIYVWGYIKDKDYNTPFINDTRCRKDQWQCDNLQCINAAFVCDGQVDCTDKSDESTTQCQISGKTCPFLFNFHQLNCNLTLNVYR